ncbi:MAG: polysaccharide biosynthesis protein [Phycisphaeraceae bacterium]|nr:polysaccharide biosynthesis protein [Phycisphaeraceae bacterium]
MQRYFMTIPEAAGLVLQSAAFTGIGGATGDDRGDLRSPAKQGDGEGIASPSSGGCGGGEVFLLDMGEPVRILDLARRFLHAQGLRPDVDVGIEFSGIRPGEKLFEELAYDGEDMIPTPHQSVRIWRSSPPRESRMQAIIATFDQLRNGGGRSVDHPWQLASRQAILDALHQAVPEMVQPASAAMAGSAPIPLPAARRAAV